MWNTKINIANCKTRKSSLGVILGRLISNHVDLWKMVCAIYVNVICMYVVGENRFWMVKERWECRENSLLSMWFVSRFFPWVTWSVSYFLCFIRCCFCVLFQHKNQVHLMLVFSNKIRHKITRAQKSSRGEIETILCSFSHHSNMPSLIIL